MSSPPATARPPSDRLPRGPRPGRPRPGRWAATALAGLVLTTAAGACDRARAATPHDVVAQVGAIEIIDPYLPVPRGRYAASVYLTIRNGGGRADELVAVGTAAARSTLVMAESDHGSVGSVAAVAELTIPAHRSVALVPGRFHLALSRPRHRLTVGEDIVVTLRFARAGAVAVEVPVVAVAVPAGAAPAGGAG